MTDMPRPRPPRLHREVSRHGRVMWYVVRRDEQGRKHRVRLKTEPGAPEFDAEYQAALTGSPRPSRVAPEAGTLAWLIARYRETNAWAGLSEATRRQRENIFKHVIETAGDKPLAQITPDAIRGGIERRKPAAARHFLDAMRGMFKWALPAKHVRSDPTASVEPPARKKGRGFRAWTEEDVTAYEARWPIGTRQRVWLDVLLYTGLRRGDAVKLGRQHVRGGIAQIETEKTGTIVTLPILPVLAATIAAGPCGDLAFICGERGRPLTKESFGNEFRDACRAAGVPGSAHGVRKIAATRAAEAGATVAQLEAIFGWSGGRMASLYTETANRRRLSIEAMHKLGTSMVEPLDEVRPREEKSK